MRIGRRIEATANHIADSYFYIMEEPSHGLIESKPVPHDEVVKQNTSLLQKQVGNCYGYEDCAKTSAWSTLSQFECTTTIKVPLNW